MLEDTASLRQTVTHLFDAVRHGSMANELEDSRRAAEARLQGALQKLESRTDDVARVLASMKDGPEEAVKDFSKQVTEFLAAAEGQAKVKLEREAKGDLDELRKSAEAERDRAIKSLEAYFASNPLPILESSVHVQLVDGVYQAHAAYECEGKMKYEFGLAPQNSKLFHEDLVMSKLNADVRIPVRFTKTVLKGRVPGFERLDQYILAEAESSSGRLRAEFDRTGEGARLKLVTSGPDTGFFGIEYKDQAHSVNVMNDPSLRANVDLEGLKRVASDLVAELEELANRKVSLTSLTLNGEDLLEKLDCSVILKRVMEVLGPKFKTLVAKMPQTQGEDSQLSLGFIRERVKVLGSLANPVSEVMGLSAPSRK